MMDSFLSHMHIWAVVRESIHLANSADNRQARLTETPDGCQHLSLLSGYRAMPPSVRSGNYAYDTLGSEPADTLTLRNGGDTINHELVEKLNERLEMAGISVLEARINYLAYAPEIAAVMLRRQQAEAIISAREKIVEGAVSMVQMALRQIDERDIVELDDAKKAAMVSNLLVVLCADESAQPVLNTGSLYQ